MIDLELYNKPLEKLLAHKIHYGCGEKYLNGFYSNVQVASAPSDPLKNWHSFKNQREPEKGR